MGDDSKSWRILFLPESEFDTWHHIVPRAPLGLDLKQLYKLIQVSLKEIYRNKPYKYCTAKIAQVRHLSYTLPTTAWSLATHMFFGAQRKMQLVSIAGVSQNQNNKIENTHLTLSKTSLSPEMLRIAVSLLLHVMTVVLISDSSYLLTTCRIIKNSEYMMGIRKVKINI